MKKKLSGLLVLVCMMFVLTGCRMYADYVVNGDGTVTVSGKTAYTETEVSMMNEAERAKLTKEVLEDGNTYYVDITAPEIKSLESIQDDGVVMTDDIFYCRAGSLEELFGEDVSEVLYMQLSVTLLSDVVDSNATLSVEGKKATFSYAKNKEAYWYAYTQKGKDTIATDVELPQMTGAKDGKYYKEMPTNIKFTDNTVVKEIKLNGKVVTPVTTTVFKKSGKKTYKTTWCAQNGKDAAKKGANTFTVTDLNGNIATYTIHIDTKKPVVKGVKNNKSYNKKAVIYVKDAKQLAKVTINGKKQSITDKKLVKKGKYKGYYKYTVKKKGTNKIVVTDAAGNKSTVKIKIVK